MNPQGLHQKRPEGPNRGDILGRFYPTEPLATGYGTGPVRIG